MTDVQIDDTIYTESTFNERGNTMSSTEKKRNTSFDLLRIISAFSVIMLHASGIYLHQYPVGTLGFRLSNFMNSISRFGVPIFVMISGAIFLSETKQISVKKLWCKNIFRMAVVFGVWSFAYYVYQSLYWWKFDFWRHGLLRTITGCVYASDHFWFLFMIMGLYALVPILRTWVHNASQKELDYFVILFVIFKILHTSLSILIDKSLIHEIFNLVKIVELSWYLGYFVLGYILVRYGVSKRIKIFLYSFVPIGIAANYLISDYMSLRQGSYTPGIYDSFGLFTFLHSAALFVFFTDAVSKIKFPKKIEVLSTNIALDTLGIYLMHVALLDFCETNAFIIGRIPPFPGVILISLFCFVVCGIVSGILRRIPFVGKYVC